MAKIKVYIVTAAVHSVPTTNPHKQVTLAVATTSRAKAVEALRTVSNGITLGYLTTYGNVIDWEHPRFDPLHECPGVVHWGEMLGTEPLQPVPDKVDRVTDQEPKTTFVVGETVRVRFSGERDVVISAEGDDYRLALWPDKIVHSKMLAKVKS